MPRAPQPAPNEPEPNEPEPSEPPAESFAEAEIIWKNAEVSDRRPLMLGAVRLEARVRIVPGPEFEDGDDEWPPDEVFLELVATEGDTDAVWGSIPHEIDTDGCDPEAELLELEGLAVPGHYVLQLTCSSGADFMSVDSWTKFVKVDAKRRSIEILFEDMGSSTSEQDTCLHYDVIWFQRSEDGLHVRAVTESEVVRTLDDPHTQQVVCDEQPFERVPITTIHLRTPPSPSSHPE